MMNNIFDDMRRAVSQAQDTLRAADSIANDMALLLRDRLRNVDNTYTLAALKRELRNFNLTTRIWKDE